MDYNKRKYALLIFAVGSALGVVGGVSLLSGDFAVGTIQGHLHINQNGAATYRIEIRAAPGRRAMQPGIGLMYSSQAGDGLLGEGWSITGLPAIRRCTVTRNLVPYPVEYDDSDRFCLDEQLLVATGEDCTDCTAYRTEIESWTSVRAYGECGQGPCNFVAIRKDGRRLDFGNSEDSRIEAVPGTSGDIASGSVRVWALNQNTDDYGNFVTYRYEEDSSTGEYRPDVILYTAHESESEPVYQRAIEFGYISRTDEILQYAGGAQIPRSRLLASITACIAQAGIADCAHGEDAEGYQPVAEYNLSYINSSLTGRSLLESIELTGADGEAFPPTSFAYSNQAADPEFAAGVSWSSEYSCSEQWCGDTYYRSAADVNGDGRSDFVVFSLRKIFVALAEYDEDASQGVFVTADEDGQDLGALTFDYGFSDDESYPRYLVDASGDGLADIVGLGPTGVYVAVAGFDSDGNFQFAYDSDKNKCTPGLTGDGWDGNANRYAGDANGDGRLDLIAFSDRGIYVALSNGNCFQDAQGFPGFDESGLNCFTGDDVCVVADVNGDGLADAVGLNASGGIFVSLASWQSEAVSYATPSAWAANFNDGGEDWSDDDPRMLIDVNGDGLADALGFGDNGLFVALSSGKSFVTDSSVWSDQFAGWDSDNTLLSVSDVNVDGLPDIVGFLTYESRVDIALGEGAEFVSGIVADLENFSATMNDADEGNADATFTGEFNGDGAYDILGFHAGDAVVALGPGPAPDLLSEIVNGLDGQATIEYESISASSGSNYTNVAATDCENCRDYRNNLYVVDSYLLVQSGKSSGDTGYYEYRYSYSYDGARWDMTGRGFLGFAEITMVDWQVNAPDGLATITAYHQEFPLTGKKSGVEVRRANDDYLLRSLAFGYCSNQGAACPGEQYPGVYMVGLIQNEAMHCGAGGESPASEGCDTDVDSYVTRVSFSFDSYGSVALIFDEGTVADPSDDFYTCTEYENDVDSNHLGFPVMTSKAARCDLDANYVCSCTNELVHEEFSYDSRWTLATRRAFDDRSASYLGRQLQYDQYGNKIKVIRSTWADADSAPTGFLTLNKTIESTFHTYPATLSVEELAILHNSESYDERFGLIKSHVDSNGVLQETAYDGFGRIVETSGPPDGGDPADADFVFRSRTWGTSNRGYYRKDLVAVDWGGTTAYRKSFIDGLGREYYIAKETESGGDLIQQIVYDSERRVSRRSLPYVDSGEAYWTKIEYDALNRVSKVTDANGIVTTTEWNVVSLEGIGRDQRIRTEAAGAAPARINTVYFNPRQKPLQHEYPAKDAGDGPVAIYQYDVLDRLRHVLGPDGKSRKYNRDTLNRVIETIDSDSGTTRYVYDEHGNLQRKTDANGDTITYAYDQVQRLKTKMPTTGSTWTFEYDQGDSGYNIGRLTAASSNESSDATFEYEYGLYGLPNTNEIQIDDLNYALGMSYDPLRRLTDYAFPDETIVRRSYTIEGYLATLDLCGGDSGRLVSDCERYAEYANFTPLGKARTLSYEPNGTRSLYTFDPIGLIKTMEVHAQGETLIQSKYVFDELYSITEIDDQSDADADRIFSYNRPGYLTGVQLNDTSWSYDYDAAGNLTEKNGTSFSYTGQRVVSGTVDGVQVYGASYDAVGQIIGRTVVDDSGSRIDYDLTYDSYHNLTGVTINQGGVSSTIQFLWDYQGRLLKRSDPDGTTTYYITSDYEVTAASGSTLHTKYINGVHGRAASISIGNIAANESKTTAISDDGGLQPGPNGPGVPAGTQFFIQDQVGSTTLVLDQFGSVQAKVAYMPYGDMYAVETTGANMFRAKFDGREWMGDASLYYFGARFYDPATGRFTSQDSGLFGAANVSAVALNAYGFAGNDPISHRDPGGHFAVSWKSVGEQAALISAPMAANMLVPGSGVVLEMAVGAYLGASVMNHSSNPAHWNYHSWRTYAGAAAGIAINEASGGTGDLIGSSVSEGIDSLSYASSRELGAEAVGATNGAGLHIAGAMAGGAVTGALSNAAMTGLAGGDVHAALSSTGSGAWQGAALALGAEVVSRSAESLRPGEPGADSGSSESESRHACGSSFAAGTWVYKRDGPVPIETLQLGDRISAYDPITGKRGFFPVTALFARAVAALIEIRTVDGTRIETTPEHPFWTTNRGWVAAGQLTLSDRLLNGTGRPVAIESVTPIAGQRRVHNLRVGLTRTYYVSSAGVLVHNQNGNCNSRKRRFSQRLAHEEQSDAILRNNPQNDEQHLRENYGSGVDENGNRRSKRTAMPTARIGAGDGILEPGEYANDYGWVQGSYRDATPAQRDQVRTNMKRFGCHRCGQVAEPGDTVADHQPPRAIGGSGADYRLYPHCRACSNLQGGALAAMEANGQL